MRSSSALIVACVVGCAGAAPSADVPPTTRLARRTVLGFDEVQGLSGLTMDGEGTLWAVPERDRFLLALRDERVQRVAPFDGALGDLDVEAVTWLGGSRFALATESRDATRTSDRIFFVDLLDGRARVVDELELPYEAVGAVPDTGDGLEGLCHVDGELIAAVEHVVEVGSDRFAACGRLALDGERRWRPFRVRLTSEVGKISDLTCRPGVGGVEVLAIERGLQGDRWSARVVRFLLPPASDEVVLAAEVVHDLDQWVGDRPNPEGLTIDRAGDLWLVVDNYYRQRTGPNELLHIPGTQLRR